MKKTVIFLMALCLAEAVEITNYAIQDIKNLQDFLLVRDTPDLSGKDYDLNDDDRWDVFDLCLMKQQFLKQSSSESKVLIAYFTRAENVYLENPDEIDISMEISPEKEKQICEMFYSVDLAACYILEKECQQMISVNWKI